jgi:Ca2+-binding EF-hand superfamily protein
MKITNPLTSAPQGKVPESAAMKNLFDGFDKDKDRALNEAEFTTFAKSMGLDGSALFKNIPQKHPGKISFQEFLKVLPEIKSALFKRFDKNHDGILDAKELKSFADEYHFDVKKLFDALGADKAGKVSLESFVKNIGKVLSHPQSFSTLSHFPHKHMTKAEVQMRAHLDGEAPSKQGHKIDFFW